MQIILHIPGVSTLRANHSPREWCGPYYAGEVCHLGLEGLYFLCVVLAGLAGSTRTSRGTTMAGWARVTLLTGYTPLTLMSCWATGTGLTLRAYGSLSTLTSGSTLLTRSCPACSTYRALWSGWASVTLWTPVCIVDFLYAPGMYQVICSRLPVVISQYLGYNCLARAKWLLAAPAECGFQLIHHNYTPRARRSSRNMLAICSAVSSACTKNGPHGPPAIRPSNNCSLAPPVPSR